jgi:hypothetical protein
VCFVLTKLDVQKKLQCRNWGCEAPFFLDRVASASSLLAAKELVAKRVSLSTFLCVHSTAAAALRSQEVLSGYKEILLFHFASSHVCHEHELKMLRFPCNLLICNINFALLCFCSQRVCVCDLFLMINELQIFIAYAIKFYIANRLLALGESASCGKRVAAHALGP